MTTLEDTYETSQETAERLGVAIVTVCRWCRTGRLPAIKHARAWYVRRGARPVSPGQGAARLQVEFESAPAAARRLGVSIPFVHRLIERGLLEGGRGPWRDYVVKAGAEPVISTADRMLRRDTLLNRRLRLASHEKRVASVFLQ